MKHVHALNIRRASSFPGFHVVILLVTSPSWVNILSYLQQLFMFHSTPGPVISSRQNEHPCDRLQLLSLEESFLSLPTESLTSQLSIFVWLVHVKYKAQPSHSCRNNLSWRSPCGERRCSSGWMWGTRGAFCACSLQAYSCLIPYITFLFDAELFLLCVFRFMACRISEHLVHDGKLSLLGKLRAQDQAGASQSHFARSMYL